MKKKQEEVILQEIKVTESVLLLPFLIDKKVKKSRSAIKALLIHKQIKVNKKLVTQHNHELKAGDVVQIMKNDHSRDTKKLKDITVVFEDEHLIVVDKAHGLLSIATDKEKRETAYSIISEYLKTTNSNARVFVLHRLDREISGLMVYAKSMQIQETMQKRWNEQVQRQSYVAVIEGQLENPEGQIVSWLTENKNLVMRSSNFDNGGQKSITNYKTIKAARRFSMISLELETKRKNQIRVHLQSLGHPIIGDKKYGSKINPIKRIALHAYELNFIHPVTGEQLEFKSRIPKLMESFFGDSAQGIAPASSGERE